MKFLCLKAVLIYGSKYLEGSWTAYAFSETAIEGILSLLESTISPTMSFQLGVQDQIWIPSCEVILKFT